MLHEQRLFGVSFGQHSHRLGAARRNRLHPPRPGRDRWRVRLLCVNAREGQYASVCVRPEWVAIAAELLRESGVKVCTVISFHEGRDSINDKVAQTRRCIADGAEEIDWVFDYQSIIEDYGFEPMRHTHLEVEAIATLAQEFTPVVFKVIVETCTLEHRHKRWICELLARTTVIGFIETSTGYGIPRAESVARDATVEDVWLFCQVIAECGSPMEVKASGGIRTLRDLLALREAGVKRFGIGSQGALNIMQEAAQVGIE